MRKRLARHGNLLALVIDKPLRHVLHIGPERLVDLSFDGRRLIVEPVDASSKPPRRVAPTTRTTSASHARTASAANAASAANVAEHDELTLEEAREAPAVISRLMNAWGMGDVTFARLADVKPRLGAYLARVSGGDERFQGLQGRQCGLPCAA